MMYGSRQSRIVALTGAVGLLVACGGGGPIGLDSQVAKAGVVARTLPDVSGEWEWWREEKLTVPDEFAFVFGIDPEGPITHFDCEVEGVITLVQNGAVLSGTEMETGSRCKTRGGQVFTQPGLGALIPIPEVRVNGNSVHLTVGDAEVICPIQARITNTEGGVATAMSGTGRCWIPGHPKSNPPAGSPFDIGPPPGGTEKITRWEAWRPAG